LVEHGLHGPGGTPKSLRDLAGAQALYETQEDDITLPLGERRKSVFDKVASRHGFELISSINGYDLSTRIRLADLGPAMAPGDRAVANSSGDCKQPPNQRPMAAVRLALSVRAQPDLLQQILRADVR
jgi:hypothetical protein